MVQVGRGMPASKEAIFKYMTEKEETMKLKWYYKNQQKLIDETKRQLASKGVSPEVLAEVEELRKERYAQMQRFGKKKGEDLPFPDIDPHSILNVMKPVDPEVTKILYKPKDIDGTKKYLRKRYELLPDERYYFPETTSFNYGWHVYDNMRNTPEEKRFGKQQIIQASFYRRNGGLVRDPEYNRTPQQTSPTLCGSI